MGRDKTGVRKRPSYHVPPRQYRKLKKNYSNLTSKQIQNKWLELQKTGTSQQKQLNERSSVNHPKNPQPNTYAKVKPQKKNTGGNQ